MDIDTACQRPTASHLLQPSPLYEITKDETFQIDSGEPIVSTTLAMLAAAVEGARCLVLGALDLEAWQFVHVIDVPNQLTAE